MICHLCGEDKLSKEFPHEHLTEDCTKHPLLHCLRCVTASLRDHQKCSQCDVKVEENNEKYEEYVQTLEFLFPTVTPFDETNTTGQTLDLTDDESEFHIVVTTLSGESTTLQYDPDQTVLDLKSVVEQELKTPCNKQSLLYNEIELKARGQNNEILTLNDYHVQPNSTIYLLVLLYAIPDGLDQVIFDLFWGYPHRGPDYLDASVFLYSGSEFIEVVDYCHTISQSCSAVRHSGDVMDDAKRLGHHTINVSIKSIPAHINKLVFTLSAWNSPNISKYPNPSLRFFDAKFPNKQLCDDKMHHAAYSQAIVMCCLTNKGSGWEVFGLKNPSSGNAAKYGPLKKMILSLIKKCCI